MEDNVIQVEHLTKKFGSFTAVDDITFEVRKGEIFNKKKGTIACPFLRYALSSSLNALPNLKAGILEAAILIFSPVLGLMPSLASLVLSSKEPKPEI